MQIIIVDDEQLSRTAFCMMIRRNCPELTIVGEAENGRQAIDLCKQLKPDIVIMDVQMPVMDGLTATKSILQFSPTTTILMLSAYSDSEYLQEAINIGAKGYFLKPLKASEIVPKLHAIIENQVSDTTHDITDMELQLMKPLFDQEIMRHLLAGVSHSASLDYCLMRCNCQVNCGCFIVVRFFDFFQNHVHEFAQLEAIKQKIHSTISHLFLFFRMGIIGKFDGHILPIFIPYSTQATAESYQAESQLIGREISRKLTSLVGDQHSISISALSQKPEDFPDLYQQTVATSNQLSPNSVAFSNLFNAKKAAVPYPAALEEKLKVAMMNGDENAATDLVYAMLSLMQENQHHLPLVQEQMLQFLCFFKKILQENAVESSQLDEQLPLSQLMCMTQLSEMERHIHNFANQSIALFVEVKSDKRYPLIRKIQLYIQDNLDQPISLQDLGDHLSMSPQHLSKVFKTELHEGFSQYVTGQKIEKTKVLLTTTNLPIAEIAGTCGFLDQNYFTKIFKKHTGATPSEYRRINYGT